MTYREMLQLAGLLVVGLFFLGVFVMAASKGIPKLNRVEVLEYGKTITQENAPIASAPIEISTRELAMRESEKAARPTQTRYIVPTLSSANAQRQEDIKELGTLLAFGEYVRSPAYEQAGSEPYHYKPWTESEYALRNAAAEAYLEDAKRHPYPTDPKTGRPMRPA